MFPTCPRTGAVQTIDERVAEINAGEIFVISSSVDLSIGQYYDIQIVTPDTTKWGHFTFKFDTESETRWYLYENVTIVLAGTAKTGHNRDRNSSITATTTVKVILNADESDANADTTVSGAMTLKDGFCGAGKDAGSRLPCQKNILKQNEDYSLRFIATSAGYVNFNLCWKEHTNQQN